MPETGLLESVTAENRHRDQTKDKSHRYEESQDCAVAFQMTEVAFLMAEMAFQTAKMTFQMALMAF